MRYIIYISNTILVLSIDVYIYISIKEIRYERLCIYVLVITNYIAYDTISIRMIISDV